MFQISPRFVKNSHDPIIHKLINQYSYRNNNCDNSISHLFDPNSTDPVGLKPEYLELWTLLSYVGNFSYFGGGILTSFMLPTLSESVLHGVPFLSDPGSAIKILTFTQENTNGPVINNDDFILSMFNNLIHYRVTWQVLSTIPTKIGFYTSDEFVYDQTNYLYLICGNHGPSIFSNGSGSFTFTGYTTMYVAVDQNVNVKLTVQTIIPEIYTEPNLTFGSVYTKYFSPKSQKLAHRKIPVYESYLTGELDYSGITVPTPSMTKLYKQMSQYIISTALNITLYSNPQIPNDLSLLQPNTGTSALDPCTIPFPPQEHTNVPITGTAVFTSILTNTTEIPCFRSSITNYGNEVCYSLARHLRQYNFYPLITFKVFVDSKMEPSTSDHITFGIYKWAYGRWQYHQKLDRKTGISLGNANLVNIVNGDESTSFDDEMVLDQEATHFNITIYGANHRRVIFNLIKVDYIRIPS